MLKQTAYYQDTDKMASILKEMKKKKKGQKI